MTDIVAVMAFLAALGLAALGHRALVPAWLLYAFAALLALGAIERALAEGPTLRRVVGVAFYALLVAAYLYALPRRGKEERQ